jgi:hypothetical protein
VRLLALFLDTICLPIRPQGPREGVLVAWGFTTEGGRVLLESASVSGSGSRTGSTSGGASSPGVSGVPCS